MSASRQHTDQIHAREIALEQAVRSHGGELKKTIEAAEAYYKFLIDVSDV